MKNTNIPTLSQNFHQNFPNIPKLSFPITNSFIIDGFQWDLHTIFGLNNTYKIKINGITPDFKVIYSIDLIKSSISIDVEYKHKSYLPPISTTANLYYTNDREIEENDSVYNTDQNLTDNYLIDQLHFYYVPSVILNLLISYLNVNHHTYYENNPINLNTLLERMNEDPFTHTHYNCERCADYGCPDCDP